MQLQSVEGTCRFRQHDNKLNKLIHAGNEQVTFLVGTLLQADQSEVGSQSEMSVYSLHTCCLMHYVPPALCVLIKNTASAIPYVSNTNMVA